MLVAVGPGAAMVAAKTSAFGHAGVALAFGLVVCLVVASSGHLGGAHINPAVTIGFWSVRRFPARDVAPYVIAQCLGAVAASAALAWLLGPVGNFGATVPALSRAIVRCGGGLLFDPRLRHHGRRDRRPYAAGGRTVRARRDGIRRRARDGTAHRRELQPGQELRACSCGWDLDDTLALLVRPDTRHGSGYARVRDATGSERTAVASGRAHGRGGPHNDSLVPQVILQPASGGNDHSELPRAAPPCPIPKPRRET